MEFGNNVKVFRVRGITIIGNKNNSMVIGADREGEKVIQYIQEQNMEALEKLNNRQKELLDTLYEYGFLDSQFQDKNNIESAYIHVNSACNLHCLGCYSFVENRNQKRELNISEWKSIIWQLVEKNVKNIVISGGEPFLRNDLIEICREIKKEKSINLEIITNGTMPIEKYEAVLPYVDALNISIDGYDDASSFIRDQGIMPTVLENICALKEKTKIKLIVTLHKKNITYMKKYEELAHRLGVFMSFSIFTVDFNKKEFESFSFGEKDFINIGNNITNSQNGITVIDTPTNEVGITFREGCGFGKNTISIAFNGDVFPCHMLQCDECRMGNVLHDKLQNIIEQPEFDVQNIELEDIEECKKCEYKYLCGGACRGRALMYTGNIIKKDPYCLAAKQFYDNFFVEFEDAI